ncbi:MAG TPA: aminotransferase class IV, partial [Rhizomicrobium sp.]
KAVIGLAKKRGYKVIERHIKPEEMANAQECFLTGTAAEVTPVSEIGPYKFKPGQITETLLNDYHADVNREVSAISLNAA